MAVLPGWAESSPAFRDILPGDMNLPRVLVTEREFQRATSVFTEAAGLTCVPVPGEEAALAAAVTAEDARFIIVGALPYRDRLYTAVPRGGVIARFGVGYDNIDRTRAAAAGIVCTNTPGVLDQSVAELTMLLIVAAARHLLGIAGQMRQQVWEQTQGLELSGRTLTIVGCGRIGGAVARIASAGFGMRVVGYRRPGSTGAVPEQVAYASIVDDFAFAVRGADFVSVHVPATPENAGFIDDARLAQLPAQAWLINTARGVVVDERALYAALASGRIARSTFTFSSRTESG